MKQLALELSACADPSFGNFVTGANAEVLGALRALASGDHAERFIYLWGTPGSGRSHLLAAVVAASMRRPAVLAQAREAAAAVADFEPDGLFALDDVDCVETSAQASLFNLYNRIRAASGALVVSGSRPPSALAVRPDLATRLAWGLVYEIRALSDEDKAVAMGKRALEHGFELPQDVCEYVLRHGRRDLPSLLALIDSLDRYSLETRRDITLPLVREVMNRAPARPDAR